MSARLSMIAIFVSTVLAIAATGTIRAQSPYPPGYPNMAAGGPPISDPYAMSSYNSQANWLPQMPSFSLPTVSDRLYWRAEYLAWRADGMETPPLVTTSPAGTPQNQAGILGMSGTSVLFGGNEINNDIANGFRTRAGLWLTAQGTWGIEAEYFMLNGDNDSYSASGSGAPILARPFFDTTNDRQTAQLVSFPGLVNGSVAVGSDSDLKSFLINARASMLPIYPTICPPDGAQDRVDWIIGYRYLELDDRLGVTENLESQVPSAPGTIALSEAFETQNQFNGLQLGVVYQANFNRAWLESMLRVGVGNNKQKVSISGSTAITELGVTDTYSGGLLAQTSNIGTYERTDFSMVPEIGLTLGFRFTRCLHGTIGYSLIYFPNVVRAGDQIDTRVNPNLIPEPNLPISGSQHPAFSFVETDYWAQGLSLGGELRF
ncbi:BBP7 family outer membrane beta-barrel protein [Novipirellula artificiosorum]|uniref:BBP7 family outer membrane beta-barrel protein n=1 Tax=Novipirellula artificiosorum TaxID=2528016 RepID=UPI0011B7D88F|nr:BBP7 family outer membrane beta-barrel protein [Novipirellula artificiosorum]